MHLAINTFFSQCKNVHCSYMPNLWPCGMFSISDLVCTLPTTLRSSSSSLPRYFDMLYLTSRLAAYLHYNAVH